MYFLSDELWFPPVDKASPDGVLAIGGDLSIERLQLAYTSGIFPWFVEGDPIVWYSPDPRMVLFPDELKISKSMQQVIRRGDFEVTFNQDFEQVIENCRTIDRKGQSGTWITDEMKEAYIKMHEIGWARSIEIWRDKKLIGGLYGIDLGSVFCGESMFSLEPNASKIAFIYLAKKAKKKNYKLIDCQIYNDHLARLGAKEIPREEFLKYL